VGRRAAARYGPRVSFWRVTATFLGVDGQSRNPPHCRVKGRAWKEKNADAAFQKAGGTVQRLRIEFQ
jgi:hypothetical protein